MKDVGSEEQGDEDEAPFQESSGSVEDFPMEDDDDSDCGSSKKKNKKMVKKSKPKRKEKKMPKPRRKATVMPSPVKGKGKMFVPHKENGHMLKFLEVKFGLNMTNLKYLWTPYVCMLAAFGVCSPELWMTLFKWLRLRTVHPVLLIYQIYSKRSAEDIYKILTSYKANYLIVEDAICNEVGTMRGCRVKDLLDIANGHVVCEEGDKLTYSKHGRFCHEVKINYSPGCIRGAQLNGRPWPLDSKNAEPAVAMGRPFSLNRGCIRGAQLNGRPWPLDSKNAEPAVAMGRPRITAGAAAAQQVAVGRPRITAGAAAAQFATPSPAGPFHCVDLQGAEHPFSLPCLQTKVMWLPEKHMKELDQFWFS
ncbi:hypothetical protein CB1_001652035 [Camelus ferus]|nr:hypothetical protein CB1_001652035 [Camelus ferus]